MALTLLPELTEKMTTLSCHCKLSLLLFPQISPPLSNMTANAMQNICSLILCIFPLSQQLCKHCSVMVISTLFNGGWLQVQNWVIGVFVKPYLILL